MNSLKISSNAVTGLLLLMNAGAGFGKTVQIRALNATQTVTVHYQSTYLSNDQLGMIAPEVLYQVDGSTGQTVADLLASPDNGIPSLSHTWLEGRRTIQFTWDGASRQISESSVISWLPASESIEPESTWQAGANYSLAATDAFMNGATAYPVAELAIIANHIRTDGPAMGWERAEADHPILGFPLLGIIPRHIAENQIDATVDSMASTVEYLTYNAQLLVDRGEFPPIVVSEDAYLAIQARAQQLASGVGYSMFANAQMVPLWSANGTTNCSRAAADLLAGGTSTFGSVPYLDLGITRGRTSASLVDSYYRSHGPSFKLHPYVVDQYGLGNFVVATTATPSRACTCKDAINEFGTAVCNLNLSNGKTFSIGGLCAQSCAAQGEAVPLLVANCATVEMP